MHERVQFIDPLRSGVVDSGARSRRAKYDDAMPQGEVLRARSQWRGLSKVGGFISI
jgi:hypothetical protein